MADSLSVAASVLAVLGACSYSVKAFRSALAAPKNLEDLETELSHLESVIRSIQTAGAQGHPRSHSPGLIEDIRLAHVKVKEVHAFFEKSLYHGGTAGKTRWRSLIRQTDRVTALAEELNGISSRLTDHITASLLYRPFLIVVRDFGIMLIQSLGFTPVLVNAPKT